MPRVALATVLLGAVALNVAAQQAVRVRGRVTADDTGDPIPNARVTLSPSGPGVPVVLSDRDGRFTFTAAASTRVTVTARKTGYSNSDVVGASPAAPIEIRLTRGGAVSGRVIDEFGDPLVSARVQVRQVSPRTPKPVVVATGQTDDRGEYHIGSLPTGEVHVVVTTRGEMVSQVTGP